MNRYQMKFFFPCLTKSELSFSKSLMSIPRFGTKSLIAIELILKILLIDLSNFSSSLPLKESFYL
jgi:hypothetical protein